MVQDIMIRAAGFEDAAEIFALIRGAAEWVLPRSLGDLIQNMDRCLVAQRDGRIAGTVSWQILPEIGCCANPAVEIKSLVVRDQERGQGVGRRLVSAAVERIATLRPREIIVLTFTPVFFGRLGFKQTSKERLMHKLYMGCMNCTRFESPFTCPEVAMSLSMETNEKAP